MDFRDTYNQYSVLVEEWLKNIISKNQGCEGASKSAEKKIFDAMEYSLMAGGKRIRPVLSLAVCDILKGNRDVVLPFAGAIELIHTYSLIHDDLPCMDNDDYRRGKLTNHKVFGEAMAVLAGDALLNLAFETMIDETLKAKEESYTRVKAASMIAKSSGVYGMIGGQVLDIESEQRTISYEELGYLHKKKTGALFFASVLAPAILLDAGKDIVTALEAYAENIGLAFQIKDDILDLEGDSKVVGKATGSDAVNNKSTYVSILGIDKAKQLLEHKITMAIEALNGITDNNFLKNVAIFIANRNK